MTADDLYDYWIPAVKKTFGAGTQDVNFHHKSNKLEKLLGTKEFSTYLKTHPSLDKPMPIELKGLLTALTGPNGPTIFKMLQIRKGAMDENKENSHSL